MTVGLLAVAVAGFCAALAAVAWHLMPRTFSAPQQERIINWEMGKRWHTWPAGHIFPPAVPYQVPAAALASTRPVRLAAHRIGIAAQASCRAGTDPAAWRVLARHGCLAVLRATYQDSTGAFAVTVGIAVLPDMSQATRSFRALPGGGGQAGIRAVRFGHTLAASFGNADRQLSVALHRGPYLIMSTVGYADGRHHVRESADPYARDEMLSVAHGISGWIGARLGATPPSPRCPGGPAC